ncbi:MAG: T9SS type A sorting domain-containing protein [bacterium]
MNFHTMEVSLKIYDINGREINKIVSEFQAAGFYSVNFNASDLSSGIYVYRISIDSDGKNFSSEKKMMLASRKSII